MIIIIVNIHYLRALLNTMHGSARVTFKTESKDDYSITFVDYVFLIFGVIMTH